jgi:hypothetical protein
VTRHEALDEILEGLQEGTYSLHHASSDRQYSVIVHGDDAIGRALGGRGDLPMSALVATHDDGSDGEPVQEALRVLSSPVFDDDGDLRRRVSTAMCAIACANGARCDDEGLFFALTASPWGSFRITYIPPDGIEETVEVDPALTALLPMVVDADWKVLETGETTLELVPFSVTVWPHLRMDHVEALRVLSELAERPIV